MQECGQITSCGVSSLFKCKAIEDLLLRHNVSAWLMLLFNLDHNAPLNIKFKVLISSHSLFAFFPPFLYLIFLLLGWLELI